MDEGGFQSLVTEFGAVVVGGAEEADEVVGEIPVHGDEEVDFKLVILRAV